MPQASNLVPTTDEQLTPDARGVPFTEQPISFHGIDYVDTVAEYFDPDPNLMRGDGLRQR